MENLVTRDRILIAKIRMFTDYDGYTGALTEKILTDQEMYRMVIFMDGEIIDFQTGDTLKHIDTDPYGLIESEIRINDMYIEELYKAPNVNKDEYEYAQELYRYYLVRKKLIEEGKLILFKQKKLY